MSSFHLVLFDRNILFKMYLIFEWSYDPSLRVRALPELELFQKDLDYIYIFSEHDLYFQCPKRKRRI